VGRRDRLIQQVVTGIVDMQDATEALDEAAGDLLGVNPTDLRCLRLIIQQRPMSPGELAQATGRTPAAITTALDRLERAGLASRSPDPDDRRRVLAVPTDQAVHRTTLIWGPLERDGIARLATYTIDQLEFLAAFLETGNELQQRHTGRIRQLGEATSGEQSPEKQPVPGRR
jgi:DNA-binding MarR family transcriptional regulator